MEEKKNLGGRPRKMIENIEVDGLTLLEQIAAYTTAEHCAYQLGMSADTLDTRLKEEYGYGFSEYKAKRLELVKISLRQKQIGVALEGNPVMLIWTGKNLLDQSDKQETKVDGEIKLNQVEIDSDDSEL